MTNYSAHSNNHRIDQISIKGELGERFDVIAPLGRGGPPDRWIGKDRVLRFQRRGDHPIQRQDKKERHNRQGQVAENQPPASQAQDGDFLRSAVSHR